MDTDDPRLGGPPPGSAATQPSRGGNRLSRRQALHRLSLGVAGGAALWAAPEILIGRPTAAGAASAAPQGGPVRPAGAGPAAPTRQADDAPGSAGFAAAGPSSEGGGGQLAFTGIDAERAVELGAGLLVGGWALTRWSSRRDDDSPGDQLAGQAPPPS